MVAIGDRIPRATLRRLGKGGVDSIETDDLFNGRKVVVFALPGAFTPTCSKSHLPGYVSRADAIKANGVDEIVCVSVNDAFVMKAWGDAHGADGKVSLLADGSAEFTRALGMELDLGSKGLGLRSQRFSMLVDDGVVVELDVEPNPGEVAATGADACLAKLDRKP